MRRLLILILAAGAIYFATTRFFDSSRGDAHAVYELFAERLDGGHFREALAMLRVEPQGAAAVHARRAWQATHRLKVTQAERQIGTRAFSTNRQIALQVIQNTFTVPGTTPPALPDYRIEQQVVLENLSGSWRITSFREEIHTLGLPEPPTPP